jgi:D-alanyl-D-alanine carboxypeptidase
MRLLSRQAAVLAAVAACLFAVAPLATAQEITEPDVVAARAIVVDAHTGDILYDKRANDPAPMASLTKLFTAFVAIETTPLDRPMTVNDSDLVGEASMGLSAGESIVFETLLHGMLLPSGNDAAHAIARNLGAQPGDTDVQATQRFIDRANARVATLGLHGTRLANPHGLDEDDHFSTARDIAGLTIYALEHEPAFAATISADVYEGDGHAITNTNRLLGAYDGLIGGKTGVTDNAGYCLMQVAERDGRRIVAVLLGSNSDAWYADAEALLDYGFAATAVPGAATRYGQISFGPAPLQVPNAQPAGASDLAVVRTGQSALVAKSDVANAPRRSPWLWIVTSVVLVPASLVALFQVQRAIRPRTVRSSRRVRVVSTARRSPPRHPPGNPLPMHEPVSTTIEPTFEWPAGSTAPRFDDTAEWGVVRNRSDTRRRDNRTHVPAFSPSFSGD